MTDTLKGDPFPRAPDPFVDGQLPRSAILRPAARTWGFRGAPTPGSWFLALAEIRRISAESAARARGDAPPAPIPQTPLPAHLPTFTAVRRRRAAPYVPPRPTKAELQRKQALRTVYGYAAARESRYSANLSEVQLVDPYDEAIDVGADPHDGPRVMLNFDGDRRFTYRRWADELLVEDFHNPFTDIGDTV